MTIVPDGKDWTWVLERACPACGADVRDLPGSAVAERIRANAARWRELLASPLVRRRPSPDRWSALEYGCHVRDVYRLYDYRLALMLEQDDPLYPNWDQDQTALDDRYELQDPSAVVSELAAAADALATRFDRVGGDQWNRPGRRSDGARFTIETFARYLIHDPLHHVYDVEQGYALLSAAR